MATEEHKNLAKFIKNVHLELRQCSRKRGADEAWSEHCSKTETLQKYAKCMEKLATQHWDNNCSDNSKVASSRIEWSAQYCYKYFIEKEYLVYRDKEIEIAKKIDQECCSNYSFKQPIKLIDVGSCYNPFKSYDFFDVLAVDLCPANDVVYECDFLSVNLSNETCFNDKKIVSLKEQSFDVVTFCFLLEYIPSPHLRVSACEKAYSILKPEGLLVVNTPDSKHVGANSKIMKCWRYTLSCMGFNRIKYEKFAHMHCMAFRKAANKATAVRWAELHKEDYMDYTLNIPQDYNDEETKSHTPSE